MNSGCVRLEEQSVIARRLCEASAWSELLDFALAWQKENPEEHRAFYYAAIGRSGLGQFVQAETAYRRALALNDSDAKVWSNLGALLYEHRHRKIDGIRCVERAVTLDPAHKVGWSNLACMVGRLGHHDQAIAFADRAIALDSQFVEAHLHKGAAARALKNEGVLREVCNALSAIPQEKFCRTR